MKKSLARIALWALGLTICTASIARQGKAESPPACNHEGCDCAKGIDVECGLKRPFVDGVGWVLGIPRKILLWDQRADNHNVSERSVDEVAAYLAYRDLNDVKVRVNQYDPVGEWQRLRANDKMGPGWKYTLGTLKYLEYTLLPGRIFGGDDYNPFTNTVSIYSDLPELGITEGAYAYDVHQRAHPGTYAGVQMLPIASIWHETLATDEVIDYVGSCGTAEERQKARQVLYARYGMSLGGELGNVLPDGTLVFQAVGAAAGHATAAVKNRRETK